MGTTVGRFSTSWPKILFWKLPSAARACVRGRGASFRAVVNYISPAPLIENDRSPIRYRWLVFLDRFDIKRFQGLGFRAGRQKVYIGSFCQVQRQHGSHGADLVEGSAVQEFRVL